MFSGIIDDLCCQPFFRHYRSIGFKMTIRFSPHIFICFSFPRLPIFTNQYFHVWFYLHGSYALLQSFGFKSSFSNNDIYSLSVPHPVVLVAFLTPNQLFLSRLGIQQKITSDILLYLNNWLCLFISSQHSFFFLPFCLIYRYWRS